MKRTDNSQSVTCRSVNFVQGDAQKLASYFQQKSRRIFTIQTNGLFIILGDSHAYDPFRTISTQREVSLEKLAVSQLVNASRPAASPIISHSKAHKSSPYPKTQFPQIRFNITLLSIPRPSEQSQPFRLSTENSEHNSHFPMDTTCLDCLIILGFIVLIKCDQK